VVTCGRLLTELRISQYWYQVPVRGVRYTLQESFFTFVPATAALVRLVAESTGNIQKAVRLAGMSTVKQQVSKNGTRRIAQCLLR